MTLIYCCLSQNSHFHIVLVTYMHNYHSLVICRWNWNKQNTQMAMSSPEVEQDYHCRKNVNIHTPYSLVRFGSVRWNENPSISIHLQTQFLLNYMVSIIYSCLNLNYNKSYSYIHNIVHTISWTVFFWATTEQTRLQEKLLIDLVEMGAIQNTTSISIRPNCSSNH